MRKPIVTRTITSTEVNVLCLNTETAEPFNKTVIVPRTYEDEKKLMNVVRGIIDNDTESAVKIVDSKVVTSLYGMYEEDFVAKAMLLDNETRKPVEK